MKKKAHHRGKHNELWRGRIGRQRDEVRLEGRCNGVRGAQKV